MLLSLPVARMQTVNMFSRHMYVNSAGKAATVRLEIALGDASPAIMDRDATKVSNQSYFSNLLFEIQILN